MINEYIYYSKDINGTIFCDSDRERTFEWYKNHNGVEIWTKTKDLFPTIEVIVDRPNIDIRNIRENDLVNKTSVSLRKAVAKYDSKKTKQIKMKLNLETDKSILEKLDSVDNIQGYLKQLILNDIAKNSIN